MLLLNYAATTLFFGLVTTSANSPGRTSKGPDVTVRENGYSTMMMANGIVSIVASKINARLVSIKQHLQR